MGPSSTNMWVSKYIASLCVLVTINRCSKMGPVANINMIGFYKSTSKAVQCSSKKRVELKFIQGTLE